MASDLWSTISQFDSAAEIAFVRELELCPLICPVKGYSTFAKV